MSADESQVCSDIPFVEGDYPLKEDRIVSVSPEGEVTLNFERNTFEFQEFAVRISAMNPKVTRQFKRVYSMPTRRAHNINYRKLYEAAEETNVLEPFASELSVEAITVVLALHDVLIRKGYAFTLLKRDDQPWFALLKHGAPVALTPLSFIELAWLAKV